MDIFAGDEADAPVSVEGGPEHVRVIVGEQVDVAFESYGEAELSDDELLAVAAVETADALVDEEVEFPRGSTLDEVELRRVRRRVQQQRMHRALQVIEGVSA